MRDTIIAAAGRSGLIVRRRLIEAMPYFLQADADWTRQHLISALLAPDVSELSLWRALARRTQRSNVLKIIGGAVVARATDLRLGRETRRSLIFSLIVECLHALHQDRASAVSYSTIQQMIRSLDDVARADAAGVVQQFVHELSAPRQAGETTETPEYLFFHVAAPFLRDVWPQERSLSTPGVSKALADLPAASCGAFVAAVDTIERFLVPFDAWSLADYGLFGEDHDKPKLSAIDDFAKSAALLCLLDCTIGTAELAVIPYDLDAALYQIEKVAPSLTRDPKFRRLATAARR